MLYLLAFLLVGCFHKGKDSEPAGETAAPSDWDGDGYPAAEDCDDNDPAIHPDASETCNGLDDDCDGLVDEEGSDAPIWFPDADGDGWGSTADPIVDCTQPSGTVAQPGDCDDADPEVNPSAAEVCENGVDDDCDGTSNGCGFSGDIPVASADARLLGSAGGSHAGYDVAGAGDVNGDGFDDVVIGAPDASYPGVWEGDGYTDGIVSGAAAVLYGPLDGETDLGAADAWIQGTFEYSMHPYQDGRACSETGHSVAGVGDTNGDGFDDVLVGDPQYQYRSSPSEDSNPNGVASLFLGPLSGPELMFEADAVLIASSGCAMAGFDVAAAGDANGDGLSDFLIGARSGSVVADEWVGEAYLFFGPVSGNSGVASADAILAAEDPVSAAGNSVSGAGDVNGDGLDDLLVGAYQDSTFAEYAGSAFLVLSPVSGDFFLTDAQLRLAGDAEYQETGNAVSGAGDLDGDGYGDFLVGVAHHALSDLLGGGVCVLYGDASGGPSGVVNVGSTTAMLHGTHGSQHYVTSLAGAGDLDLDGFSDFLVGSDAADEGGTDAGTTWLVYGPVSGVLPLDEAASARFLGAAEGDEAGFSVAGAGDVDADGYGDLLIGAPGEDSAGSGAGAAYLFYGRGL